jgi:AmmeMemoRadiSam system protein B
MSSHNETPRLRHVEPVPVTVNGQEAIGLRDPLGLSDRMLCVGKETLPVLALMDGRRSLLDIQTALTLHRGTLVFSDQIKEIVEMLDNAYLLDGERFREAYRRKVAEYRALPFREASHAGVSYSEDPDELRRELDLFFTGESGPGAPEFDSEEKRPVGLIAPHIDIRSGGPCFAHGYHALASGRPSDVYVIFGTGHAGVRGMFTATNLDFDTPLGRVETDKEFLTALADGFGEDPSAEEILHAAEHVIEFQVIFLQHVLSGRSEFTIVPVLCSLSHHIFDNDASSGPREVFERFCGAVREACGSRSVCFIASADLDHIGPRYGDSFTPHAGTVRESLDRDRELMASLERLDTDAFIGQVAADGDSKRICGFSPITAMLRCMDASEGRLLSLDHAQVDARNSFVSFASMIFY